MSANKTNRDVGQNGRVHSRDALEALGESDLEELYRFWGGSQAGTVPADAVEVRRRVHGWMGEPETIEERVRGLGRRLAQILDAHLRAAGHQLSLHELSSHRDLSYLSPHDLEAGLALLERRGLLVSGVDPRFKGRGGRTHAVPADLADRLLRRRREKQRGLFHSLTLRGWLERAYENPRRGRRIPSTQVRKMYKMYVNETAVEGRIERLPPDLRGLVEKAILQFGGVLPRGLFERMDTRTSSWQAERWRGVLEESLLGTVERLELARYGIQHADETLILFNEVALAWLKRVAVPGDPDEPHHSASLSVDLVSNVSRFLAFILEHNVRFTVRGEIFKTTEKRILSELIPNPGRELSRSEVLGFIYDFARHGQLIESTGERTFALTGHAREWEQQTLEEKLRRLLEYAVEERLGGDPHHQVLLRRAFLRMLKRIEPDTWYDLMYLPFLARNTYLASLDEMSVEEYFAARGQGGYVAPMEDPQRLAWNLAKWVRQRVYLLGLVDLGYDASDRPVAMRLTRIGARLLGLVPGLPEPGSGLGSLVVTPDFEVVMFPNGDDAELVHELDRFCVREKAGPPMHFRITDRSVQRGLSEGVLLGRILSTLKLHSRTPVPQNVLFSVRDWAVRGGLMLLDARGVLRCEDPQALKRFAQDPAVRTHVRELLDEGSVQLKTRYSMRRLQGLLRDLDYLVELED